ncbi:MAG: hypothetical protein ACP5VE_12480 [Chthonomonadales bacterium]
MATCAGVPLLLLWAGLGWSQPAFVSGSGKTPAQEVQPPLVVPSGRVYVGDLSVTRRKVEIRGILRGNLLAMESPVLLARGCHVTGDVLCIGSPLVREPGARVDGRVKELQMPSNWAGTYEVGTLMVPSRAEGPPQAHRSARDMVRGQVVLTLLGLVGLLISLVVAPKATRVASDALAGQPGRSLAWGVLALPALGVVEAVNAILFRTVVWIPVGVVVLAAGGVLVVYSGLLGLIYVGGHVLRRIGRGDSGTFARGATALVLFGVLNCLPIAQVFSVLLELLLFVLGAGALVVTGLGHDPCWLDRRRGLAEPPAPSSPEPRDGDLP